MPPPRPPIPRFSDKPPLPPALASHVGLGSVLEDAEGIASYAHSQPSSQRLHHNLSLSHSDSTPLSTTECFNNEKLVILPEKGITYKVYYSGSCGPVLVFIHGAGFAAPTWSLVAKTITASENYRLIAIDLKGHGDSIVSDTTSPISSLFQLDSLAEDIETVIIKVFPETLKESSLGVGGNTPVIPVTLVGHSMGGAVVVRCATKFSGRLRIGGVVVIDIVEGSALASLDCMIDILAKRPTSFLSEQHAIEWCVAHNHMRSLDAARYSMPSQIRKVVTENEEVYYEWRVDLVATKPCWKGWFTGLSNDFLSIPGPKMLMLAGTDRLDTPLMIGAMQGKFQSCMMPACGHVIQEDEPVKVAMALIDFIKRNGIGLPRMALPGWSSPSVRSPYPSIT